jgi:anti-sigma-K factor RskA
MSEKLEPEYERIAQMLAQAGPLPNAPDTLRDRVLRIPDGDEAPAQAAAAAQPATPPAITPPARRRIWRNRPRPLVLAGLAATVIAIAIVPVVALEGGSDATAKRIELSPRSFAPKGGGDAQVVSHHDGSATITLSVWKMPNAGYERVYEAWLGRQGDRLPLGTFGTDPTGKATISLTVPPGELANYRWLWVTSEPKGGSHTPSKSTALWGPLT